MLNKRLTGANQASVSYKVSDDGTTTFDYAGAGLRATCRPMAAYSPPPRYHPRYRAPVFACEHPATKWSRMWRAVISAPGSAQPVTGVTELMLDTRGQTAETVLRDSAGSRNYAIGQNFMLVKSTGQIETRDADGAVSPDGRIMFIVRPIPTNTRPLSSMSVEPERAVARIPGDWNKT